MDIVLREWFNHVWPKNPTLEDFERMLVENNYLFFLFYSIICQIQCKFIVRNLLLTFDHTIFQDDRHKMAAEANFTTSL